MLVRVSCRRAPASNRRAKGVKPVDLEPFRSSERCELDDWSDLYAAGYCSDDDVPRFMIRMVMNANAGG